MTATATPAPSATTSVGTTGSTKSHVFSDISVITWRNLLNVRRVPQLLIFSTIQPVIFVLLFRYVFGGAIKVPGLNYVDFLMPGVFAQTVAFGAIGTGVGLAEDLSKGLIERFRSLPMARSAVLVGRSISDLARNVFVVFLMVAVGFTVGFRIHAGVFRLLVGIGLLLLFGFALSSIFALVGLATRNGEATQAAAFPLMAPLVFASSTFVPISSMPSWLQVWARNQPVSVTVAAIRRLCLGNVISVADGVKLGIDGSTWALIARSLAWSVGIVLVFAPIAVNKYRKST